MWRQIQLLMVEAGYPEGQPIVVGLARAASETILARGVTNGGHPLEATTVFYGASLSKQITAACAAVLSERGSLDLESAVSQWLPELPGWADEVRLRHLLYHAGGLPADSEVDAIVASHPDRTTAGVLSALSQFPYPPAAPGSRYEYSNAGYVCLGAAVERAAGVPLASLAQEHLFTPLDMTDTRYWSGPLPAPSDALPLRWAHPAPLSLGDGGVWSTATDLLRWCRALNEDKLGITVRLQRPGRLDDGQRLDYAWGMGVRQHQGLPAYRHGGGWPGIRALLVRIPQRRSSLLLVAPGDDSDRLPALTDALLDALVP